VIQRPDRWHDSVWLVGSLYLLAFLGLNGFAILRFNSGSVWDAVFWFFMSLGVVVYFLACLKHREAALKAHGIDPDNPAPPTES